MVRVGKVYVRPDESDILAPHGAKTTTDARRCDVAIVGAGSAGLTPAVYAASEGHGEIVVLGKGNRAERLPLPAEVGAAIAAYLRHGRPVTAAGRK